MINRKDTPAPFMNRSESSSTSHTTTTTTTTTMPPKAPPNKGRGNRASKSQRGRETYTGSNARGSADGLTRDARISHDLNLTDNPRHSVVDNMLMSLNPDQSKFFSASKDRPAFSSGSDTTGPPRTSYSRHLHSSSTNSDYIFPSDDSPDRRTPHFGKGRRSNSSSDFPTTLPRIDSIRTQAEAADSKRPKAFGPPRGGTANTATKGHAKKTSKGSTSSSLDYGQTRVQSMMPSAPLGRRSASFDHGYTRTGLQSASSSGTHPPMPNNMPRSLVYNDIDAAPMPTVPAGPRRGDQSPAFPPSPAFSPTPMHLPPTAPVMQRKNSNKSSKSLHANKVKGGMLQWDAPAPPTSTGFMNSRRGSKHIQQGLVKSRQTSPTRAASGPLSPMQDTGLPPKDTVRDRPSFFRRVFSRGLHTESQPSQQPHQTKDATKAQSRSGQASANRLYKPPAMEDLTQPQRDTVPPPLAKKPSSFFRRRKKSVSEATPAIPPHLQPNIDVAPAEAPVPSPTSSLRRVMNPYLADSLTDPRLVYADEFDPPGLDPSMEPKFNKVDLRPSTEPAPQESKLVVENRAKDRRNRGVPSPIDTSNARSFLSLKAADHSFLRDDSSDSRTPEPNENAMPFRSFSSRPQTSNAQEFTPRTTSKNFTGVLSPRNANVPSSDNNGTNFTKNLEDKSSNVDSQATSTKKEPSPTRAHAKADVARLGPSDTKETIRKTDTDLAQPDEGTDASPANEVFYSASSTIHSLNDTQLPKSKVDDEMQKDSIDIDPTRPTYDDRHQAKMLFDGDETITSKSNMAAWLGEPGPDRARVRKAYIELFKWQNLNILTALRDLCGKLYLKGESQQVDRILDAFSQRWCACNPLHGFKATDVVHTICYSVLLLNTDLHQAEIESKMTRTQFLKNIMPTIRRVVTDAAPDAFVNPRASTLPPGRPWEQRPDQPHKSPTFHESSEGRRSFEGQRPIYRLSQRPSDQTAYSMNPPPSPLDYNTNGSCGPLVRTPFHGKLSTWENQIEIVLKDFYNSVRQEPLPLFGSEHKVGMLEAPASTTSLSAATGGFLRRTPSMLSKAGSENQSYSRGRAPENRLGTGRWQSKTRSRPRLYPSSTVASSRRSSFDEQSSVTSPSVTSAWSKFSSLGKTQTTMSTDSFASSFPQVNYQQSIGFANALSQAIIREEGTGGEEESLRAAPLLEDERLELAGAPWAKEGILKHKHHLESIDKKAKDRNWVESFAVIEKGYMRLFSFSMNAKSLRQKAKTQRAAGGVVGGGNWADNAELLGSFVLRQTIANALPPPGYSKARPHVWALSLPTGAVHLFQVGTPDIVQEFVKTANYWSARLSKEPLVGAVSNIEYGWSESVINAALVHPEVNVPSSGSMGSTRPSLQSSIRSARSSVDQGSYKPKLPGDKITINDWTPPPQSMVASALLEVDQLKALSNYVKTIEEEFQKHNELRGAVLLAVSQSNCTVLSLTAQRPLPN